MWRHQNPLEDQSNFLHHENFLQDWTWKIISDVIFNFSKNVIPNNRLLITRKFTHRMTHPQIKNKDHREIVKIWRVKVPIEKFRLRRLFFWICRKKHIWISWEIHANNFWNFALQKWAVSFRWFFEKKITKCVSKISQWTIDENIYFDNHASS